MTAAKPSRSAKKSRSKKPSAKPSAAAPSPEALALIEFSSIAVGTRAVDGLIKKAPVTIEKLGSLQPGKFAVMFSGDVASVQASYGEAIRLGGQLLSDRVLLPFVHESVYRAATGTVGDWDGDTLGMIETCSLAGSIQAADAAVKGALINIVQIRLGDELGGKGLVHLVGEQHDVEAALELAVAKAQRGERVLHSSITPRLDEELRGQLQTSTRFWGNG